LRRPEIVKTTITKRYAAIPINFKYIVASLSHFMQNPAVFLTKLFATSQFRQRGPVCPNKQVVFGVQQMELLWFPAILLA
jgi:hypothetical protein